MLYQLHVYVTDISLYKSSQGVFEHIRMIAYAYKP